MIDLKQSTTNFKQAQLFVKPTPEAEQVAADVRDMLRVYQVEEVHQPSPHAVGIVIGGDGTFLYAASQAVKVDMPLAGINLGRLGFLTTIDTDKLHSLLSHILKGTVFDDYRPLFSTTYGQDTEIFLNDFTLNRKTEDKMIDVAIHATQEGNTRDITSFRADGLVVSTPTGSTAYNLSAGGPVVHPDVQALVLTPICPHTLQLRPVVLPPQEITLTLNSPNPAIMTLDGRVNLAMNPGQSVTIAPAGKLRILHAQPRNFFHVLQEKMNWQPS